METKNTKQMKKALAANLIAGQAPDEFARWMAAGEALKAHNPAAFGVMTRGLLDMVTVPGKTLAFDREDAMKCMRVAVDGDPRAAGFLSLFADLLDAVEVA